MSVIFFGSKELANLCAACSARSGLSVQKFFGAATLYSQSNAACYNFQYRQDIDPVEASDLQQDLPKQVDFGLAESTANLLRYNLYANNGFDFAEAGSEKACDLFSQAFGFESARRT